MVDGIFVFLRQYLIFWRGSGTIYQKINLSTGWASYFCVTPLFETFWSGSLNWARFPLLSYSSPLLSPFLSSPLNWALFWAKLLNWALFWANPLVWALFWALKRVNLLSRALFWVVLLFWVLFWALKKALKLRHNLYELLRLALPNTLHARISSVSFSVHISIVFIFWYWSMEIYMPEETSWSIAWRRRLGFGDYVR